jgi:hypothetical protein
MTAKIHQFFHHRSKVTPSPIRAAWNVAQYVIVPLSFFLLIASVVGCTGPGVIQAQAIDGSVRRVADRHDEYVQRDQFMSELERRIALRDTELLRKVLDEAKVPE